MAKHEVDEKSNAGTSQKSIKTILIDGYKAICESPMNTTSMISFLSKMRSDARGRLLTDKIGQFFHVNETMRGTNKQTLKSTGEKLLILSPPKQASELFEHLRELMHLDSNYVRNLNPRFLKNVSADRKETEKEEEEEKLKVFADACVRMHCWNEVINEFLTIFGKNPDPESDEDYAREKHQRKKRQAISPYSLIKLFVIAFLTVYVICVFICTWINGYSIGPFWTGGLFIYYIAILYVLIYSDAYLEQRVFSQFNTGREQPLLPIVQIHIRPVDQNHPRQRGLLRIKLHN